MKIDHLSKEEKETIVRYLLKCYRTSCENVQYLEECSLVNERMEEYRAERKTCLLIERALDDMEVALREFLLAELSQKKKIDLSDSTYSRSQYYRLRALAVDDFLRCL